MVYMAVLIFESADEIIKCVDHSIKATVSLALKTEYRLYGQNTVRATIKYR